MRKNVIKVIIQIAINTAAITIAYKLGEKSGYNDGELAGGCKRCVMYDEDSGRCADIPDFDRIYS